MATYTIDDLNDMLFTAMEKVMDGTMDLDRAAKVADIGQVVVNAAKAQTDFCKVRDDAGKPAFFGERERTKAIGHD